ncbi:cell wall-binding repeat-containing protein [Lihuaxuella thermophila]|uniref:Putative cell wall binding repeat 2 n=1 Tax=Lihuaxuella thermophila TaxID=1173111 RepID=A0A1H8I0K0_9BACL|nr:cell wall-binding repeat-containing protein [Lihuaxuella thermophila]SEN61741.1 Putative cell wall binding repeat 2 [Lihuaxuella thermophila]
MKSCRWAAGILTVALVASVSLMDRSAAVHAAGGESLADELIQARKHQIMLRIGEFAKKKREVLRNRTIKQANTWTAGSEATGMTEVVYSGSTPSYRIPEYVFRLSQPSTVHVTAEHSTTLMDYLIAGVDANGNLVYYQDGDTLPAGEYSFIVISESKTPLNYQYRLSGLRLAAAPDQTLPALTFETPDQYEQRLPQGTRSLTLKGSTDADFAEYSLNGSESQSLERDFSVSVPLHAGFNSLKVNAFEFSGNAVYDDFTLIVPTLQRIGGADRYEVSANISKELGIDSSTVVIARGDLYADALSGVPLASMNQAPILLTKTGFLPPSIKEEILRRNPDRAIILGGTGAVSATVETELKQMGVNQVERIAGATRYAVSAAIAEQMKSTAGDFMSDVAFIASGENFPDALAASSVAGQAYMPILLVKPGSIPPDIENFIKSHPEIGKFVIVGGTGAVSDAVANKIASYGRTVERIGGSTRYQTAVNIANKFQLIPNTQVFARGDDFPDALSGGPFAAHLQAPILLTPPASLESNVKGYLTQNSPDVAYILGSEGAVSRTVEEQISQYIR